jgi:hypothetical protein
VTAKVKVEPVGPLILVRAVGALEVDEVAQLTSAVEGFVVRRAPFLIVIDGMAATGVSAAARKHLGEHRRDHLARGPQLEIGLVLATSSGLIRGVATAVSWISGSLDTLRVVEDRAALAPRARQMLTHREVSLDAVASGALDAFTR